MYFTDSIPDDLILEIQSCTAKINELTVTNISEEIGTTGEIYPSAVPYRLILERPPGFIEDNPLSGSDELVLTYHVRAPTNIITMTQYAFPGFSWVGYIDSDPTESIFGYSEFPLSTLTVLPNPDSDGDGVLNEADNCPTVDNPYQEDNYPPEGNNIGDACECHSDCDSDGKVQLSDLVIMKQEFMKTPVNADCNYDSKVDLADLVIMKNEFMRIDCPVYP